MKIALAQINPTICDIVGNVEKIEDMLKRAREQSVDIVAFPEMITIGYPANDLLFRPEIIKSNVSALEKIASMTDGFEAVAVGFARPRTNQYGWDIDRQHLANSYAIFKDGKIIGDEHLTGETLFDKVQSAAVSEGSVGIGDKICLPNYGVYDDMRHFVPGKQVKVFEANGLKYGVIICEDLWYKNSDIDHPVYPFRPVKALAEKGVDFIFVLNTSAYHVGKEKTIEQLVSEQARENNVGIGYVNIWGGNDKILSSGHSIASDKKGNIIARAQGFKDDLLVFDFGNGVEYDHSGMPESTDIESRYKATVVGTKDYLTKCGFEKAVVGVSGGIDSAVSLAITAEAVGAENVLAVLSPSRYSKPESTLEAIALCENLGVEYKIVPIEEFEAIEGGERRKIPALEYVTMAEAAREKLQGEWAGVMPEKYTRFKEMYGKNPENNFVYQNAQAIDRMSILRGIANEENRLVIGTSNKVELAFGYFTVCGDGQSDLLIIGDWYKQQIYDFAREYNESKGKEIIPQYIIERPPSAELEDNQVDPWQYAREDEFVRLRIEEYKTREDMLKLNAGNGQSNFTSEEIDTYFSSIDINEHKRFRAGYVLKVTPVSFGEDRRINTAKNIQLVA